MKRVPLSTWFHLIEAKLPSGEARVVATLCSRTAVEKLKVSLEKTYVPPRYAYTITSAPIYEPNRRCDVCSCSKN
jgi:hypothetical protein